MKQLLLALQFLTVLPVRVKGPVADSDLGRSMAFFPLAGSMMGAVLAGLHVILKALPPETGAALWLAVATLLSGALHLDGLADSVDGLYGQREVTRRLEIMRDSRVGAMGAVALMLVLLVKWSALTNLWEGNLVGPLILAFTWSRWMQAVICVHTPYARQTGRASAYAAHGPRALIGMYLLPIVIVFWLIWQLAGVAAAAVMTGLFWLLRQWIVRLLGGVTGDVLGLFSELSETAVLVLTVLLRG